MVEILHGMQIEIEGFIGYFWSCPGHVFMMEWCLNRVLGQAVKDIDSTDLSSRLGATNRAASSRVRQLLREQW